MCSAYLFVKVCLSCAGYYIMISLTVGTTHVLDKPRKIHARDDVVRSMSWIMETLSVTYPLDLHLPFVDT